MNAIQNGIMPSQYPAQYAPEVDIARNSLARGDSVPDDSVPDDIALAGVVHYLVRYQQVDRNRSSHRCRFDLPVLLAAMCLAWCCAILPAPGQSESRFGDVAVDRESQSEEVEVARDALGGTQSQRPEIGSFASKDDALSEAARNATPQLDAQGEKAGGMARSVLGVVSGAGPMLFPILGCSFLLVTFVLERVISLRRSRVIPKHFVKLFMTELEEGQLKPDEALDLCEENRSPISEVFAAAVKKWNRPAVEVEQAVLDAGERVAVSLRRYLRLFNGIATVSPLLGLLGTVLGMISAFDAIASSDAMGRPELLAEGIGQALLTTAGGLSVAIPAFIAYLYFTSRVDRLTIDIDALGQDVVSAIASDAWKSKSKRTAAKSTTKAA